MMLTGHALIRFLERIEGMSFERERALCAAELGFVSSNAVDCARFLGWMRSNQIIDTAAASERCMAAIASGAVNYIVSPEGAIVTILTDSYTPPPIDRTLNIWGGSFSRAARRRIIAERAFGAETYRTISPRKRRSRSRTAEE